VQRRQAGFSLIEVMIALVVLGLLLGFGIPALGRMTDDLALRGAADQITSLLVSNRERAIATHMPRTMYFQAGHAGTDYRLESGGALIAGWKLNRRLTYVTTAGTIDSVTLTADGRCSVSGLVIFRTMAGQQDTVGVLSSGLILRQ
jgi:prepilin-type N-terminal cleavage/methylation domain-containing protein